MGQALSVSISRAQPDDVEPLAELSRASFLEAYEGQIDAALLASYTQKQFRPAKWIEMLRDPRQVVIVARDSGALVGYAALRVAASPLLGDERGQVELSRLYLRKTHWRTGLGGRLLREVLRVAADAGHQVLWLAVWKENPRAIAFYERQGFARRGSTSFWMGTTEFSDWVLSRAL